MISIDNLLLLIQDFVDLLKVSSLKTKLAAVIVSGIFAGYITLTVVYGKRLYGRWCDNFEYKQSNGGGDNQSPIVIIPTKCIQRQLTDSLIWIGYNWTPRKMYVRNEKCIVRLKIVTDHQILFQCGQNCLTGPYAFQSIDFHWSQSNCEGTEHRIDRKGYALEMQVMHKANRRIPNELNPISTIIISYLFQISEIDNPNLNPIIQQLDYISKSNSQKEIQPPFPLQNLCPPFVTDFFSYFGSLSQPPYTENVLWMLPSIPLSIGLKQMRSFRAIKNRAGVPILSNCRPVHNLNGRTVYLNDYDCRTSNDHLFTCYCSKIN